MVHQELVVLQVQVVSMVLQDLAELRELMVVQVLVVQMVVQVLAGLQVRMDQVVLQVLQGQVELQE